MSTKIAPPFDVKAATQLLDGAGRRLKQKQWFASAWLYDVHPFPPAPAAPECATLHVYRPGWFNEDGQGIHFETFIGAKEWKHRQLSIAMHIFHCDKIPGTSIARKKVAQPFVDEVYERVSSWPGYSFRVGKYGAQPFTYLLDFDFDKVDSQMEKEISRLCKELGPIMDRTLDGVLKLNRAKRT